MTHFGHFRDSFVYSDALTEAPGRCLFRPDVVSTSAGSGTWRTCVGDAHPRALEKAKKADQSRSAALNQETERAHRSPVRPVNFKAKQ